jgi:peptidyl-prolyl cis-trans isomerase B (cyclophilin B)
MRRSLPFLLCRKRGFSLAISAVFSLACGYASAGQTSGDKIMVEMTTSKGVIELALDTDKAPITVANFLAYVESNHYDGTIFHRVIPGFVIQGGGMESGMHEKATREPIENEADNGLKNLTGTICMARTQEPHSATSQFFINLKDNSFLDHTEKTAQGWGYAVFGRVTSGMEVVELIAGVQTGDVGYHSDVPLEDVVLEKVAVRVDKD